MFIVKSEQTIMEAMKRGIAVSSGKEEILVSMRCVTNLEERSKEELLERYIFKENPELYGLQGEAPKFDFMPVDVNNTTGKEHIEAVMRDLYSDIIKGEEIKNAEGIEGGLQQSLQAAAEMICKTSREVCKETA